MDAPPRPAPPREKNSFLVHPCPKLLSSLTDEWLEHLVPVPGFMGSNPAVSGVIREGRATKSDDFSEKCQRGHSASEFEVQVDIFVFIIFRHLANIKIFN